MSPDHPSYRAVLRTPHVLLSFLPSVLGRLSLATSGLAVVLLLQRSTGSFAVAGTVVAAIGIANVVVIPWRARLVDRLGHSPVLAVLGVVHAGALVALGVAAGSVPAAALVGIGVVAGCGYPPYATAMRVLWSEALPRGGMRTRGFGLDAVSGELSFAVGPLLAAALSVAVGPLAALLIAAGGVVVGAVLFAASPRARERRGSEREGHVGARRRHRASSARGRGPLRRHGMRPVLLAMVAPGIVLGSVDIAAPAIGADASDTLLSGALLALFAGASGASGLLFGLLRVRLALERQLLTALIPLILVAGVTGLVGGTIPSLVGFALAGACLAPGLIVGYLAGDARAAPESRTESNGWLDTAVQSGVAIGTALAGALSDAVTPGHALSLSVLAAAGVLALAAPFLLRVRGDRA